MVEYSLSSAFGEDLRGQNFLERGHAAGILAGCADGNANKLRERVAAHWTRDHPAFLELFEDRLAVADFHENEIRRRWDVIEIHLAEFAHKEIQTLRIVL